MENVDTLRDLKKEVLNMTFSYKNVHRIMYIVYYTKDLFESSSPIANKDIALHQTNKVIENEIHALIKSNSEEEIKSAFRDVIDNFKLVLAYIS